jgi:hypothetical protein
LTVAAARALAGLAGDHAGLVTGCRQMVDRHPGIGALWWLSARLLTAENPERESWAVCEAVEGDPTPGVLAAELPEEASVVVLGWPELVVPGLYQRGDLSVFIIDALGEGAALAEGLTQADVDAVEVPELGIAAAVAYAASTGRGLVVLEALALGPGGLVATTGSRAAAAVAATCTTEVWAVAGAGRILPLPMWNALVRRMERSGDPWDQDEELVPLELVGAVIGPWGRDVPQRALAHTDCPVTPELFKSVFAPGTQREPTVR